MTQCTALGLVIVTLSLLLASGKTAAQGSIGLRPGRWTGSIETGYELGRQQTRSQADAPIDFRLRRTIEKITIGNERFFYEDPRLMYGNAAVTLGSVQDRQTVNGEQSTAHASLLGYGLDLNFFAASPYSGSVYANRTQNFYTQPFGRSELRFENRGATFRLGEESKLNEWGITNFSSNVRLEQQRIEESTTSALGQTFRRDETRNVFSLDGHKGFETSDLDWRYEVNHLTDPASPRNTFSTRAANLNYSLDFGPTLNRRWDSRLYYYNRNSFSPYSIFTANEQVRIDHYSNLSTGYRYLFARAETPAGMTTTQNALFDVRHQLYQNLTTIGQVSALRDELPVGTRTMENAKVDFQYRRKLPWDGRTFLHAGAGQQLNDNRLRGSQINVTDEAHGAPSALGAGAGFLLDQPFVIPATIVVVDTRGGARLPTTLGIDYEIVQEGNLTRIVPLVTSAVIQPGDPLVVTYTYDVEPSIKYRTATSSLGGGVDFRWIGISFGHEQADQKLVSGRDNGFLQNLRKDTAQLDLRGYWEKLQAQAGTAYVHYDSTRLAYRQQRYYELTSYRPTRTLGLSFNADWTLTDYTLPVRKTDARTLRANVDWYAPGGWLTTAMVAQRVYHDTLLPTETIDEATLTARLNYGKLSFVSGFNLANRKRDGFEIHTWRLNVTVIRRF